MTITWKPDEPVREYANIDIQQRIIVSGGSEVVTIRVHIMRGTFGLALRAYPHPVGALDPELGFYLDNATDQQLTEHAADLAAMCADLVQMARGSRSAWRGGGEADGGSTSGSTNGSTTADGGNNDA